jgi:hypothetical protein
VNRESTIRAVSSAPNNFLFHASEFIFRDDPSNIISFSDAVDGVEVARIHFSKNDRRIYSLERSPFGGFILDAKAKEENMTRLIHEIESWAIENKIPEISIRTYPEIYNPEESQKIRSVLERFHFKVIKQEVLQVIPIDANSLTGLNRNRKRMLKRCIDAGLTFEQLTTSSIEEAHEIFVECREDKNYPVTMSLGDMRREFKNFPDRYFLFGVKDKDTLIAASVCIQVNDRILYDFFHGDKLKWRELSPVTLLVKGIIEFCQVRHFQLLDLGVSTDDAGINAGLHRFKDSFKARTSEKLTFSKRMDKNQ